VRCDTPFREIGLHRGPCLIQPFPAGFNNSIPDCFRIGQFWSTNTVYRIIRHFTRHAQLVIQLIQVSHSFAGGVQLTSGN